MGRGASWKRGEACERVCSGRDGTEGRAPHELGGGGGAAVAPFLSRGAAVAGRGGAGRLGKHVPVLSLGGGGPKGVLGVEAVGGGAMDATASSLAQGKTRLGSGERERSGEGSSTSAARAKGEETGKEGGEARSVGSSRLCRGGSASNLGVRAGDGDAWRFEKLQEGTRGAKRAGARRGSGAWPTARRRRRHGGKQRKGMEVMA